jgi:hypothetical protein
MTDGNGVSCKRFQKTLTADTLRGKDGPLAQRPASHDC